jgi:predicted bacteriocin transport accessory protein
MKKVLILIIFLLLIGCTAKESSVNNNLDSKDNNPIENDSKDDNPIENDIEKMKEEYESLNGTSVEVTIDSKASLKYLDSSEIIDFVKNSTGILYIGYPTCPWCRNIIPVLLNVGINNNETIYYVNSKKLKQDDIDVYNELINLLGDYLRVDSQGNKVLYVPDVYFIKDGKIVGHHLGSVSSQTNPKELLNDEQKQELYNIYEELLNEIGKE